MFVSPGGWFEWERTDCVLWKTKRLPGVDVGINRRRVCRRWVDDEEDGCRWA